MRRLLIAVVVVGGGLALGACGSLDKATEPFQDSPRSGTVNKQPADIITMPDGFNNAATKCDHGNRIYSTYHGDKPYGGLTVVPNDPTCEGK